MKGYWTEEVEVRPWQAVTIAFLWTMLIIGGTIVAVLV